jgi:ferrochelatase
MSYGRPSIASALDALRGRSCRRILIFPLFPQYAGATVGSTFDFVAAALCRWRWVPELRFINHYHDDAAYIGCLARSVRELWQAGGEPQRLLMSFHGMPKSHLRGGDPYHCQCHKTARLLAEELRLPDERWQIAFQSRFGRAPWLQPHTDETLVTWGRNGIRAADVISPGFAADCLETTEEIAVENRARYLAAGGQQYRYIPALNDRGDHLDALTRIAKRHLHGWVTPLEAWDAEAAHAEADARSRRAKQQRDRGLNV